MVYVNRRILCLVTLLSTQLVWAAPPAGDNSYWQCTVSDNENNQWIGKSAYQRMAVNNAFDACKKQSREPSHCKAAKEACESIVHGVSTRPMWRCSALDHDATPWVSNMYTQRDDAALAAKAYCQERSSIPASCYVNLLTCSNVNDGG